MMENIWPSNITVIKYGMKRWTGHLACKGAVRCSCKIFVVNPEGKRLFEILDVDGRII
jgi:putative methionine-R-sulfoxide reductase with GAF domain